VKLVHLVGFNIKKSYNAYAYEMYRLYLKFAVFKMS